MLKFKSYVIDYGYSLIDIAFNEDILGNIIKEFNDEFPDVKILEVKFASENDENVLFIFFDDSSSDRHVDDVKTSVRVSTGLSICDNCDKACIYNTKLHDNCTTGSQNNCSIYIKRNNSKTERLEDYNSKTESHRALEDYITSSQATVCSSSYDTVHTTGTKRYYKVEIVDVVAPYLVKLKDDKDIDRVSVDEIIKLGSKIVKKLELENEGKVSISLAFSDIHMSDFLVQYSEYFEFDGKNIKINENVSTDLIRERVISYIPTKFILTAIEVFNEIQNGESNEIELGFINNKLKFSNKKIWSSSTASSSGCETHNYYKDEIYYIPDSKIDYKCEGFEFNKRRILIIDNKIIQEIYYSEKGTIVKNSKDFFKLKGNFKPLIIQKFTINKESLEVHYYISCNQNEDDVVVSNKLIELYRIDSFS